MMQESRQTVLIVEDEPKIAGLLADYLSDKGGFEPHVLDRGDVVVPTEKVTDVGTP